MTAETGFPVEVMSGVPVVVAPQEIDITNADELRAALSQAVAHGQGRVVVDMTRTRFCDSSGIQALATAHRRALEENRQLLLAVSAPAVLRILALTGVDQMIPSFGSLDEALGHAAAAGGGPAAAGP